MVADNIVTALVPKSCMTKHDDIVALLLSDLRMKRSIVVVSRNDKILTHREQIFIDMLREILSVNL